MNVLVILADQFRHDYVGYRQGWLHTPNLNALAAASVDCVNTFVQSPQCQPSRASILTGRYPTAHRMWWNSINMPISELTIANIMRDAGYKTAYFGKIHLAERHDERPLAHAIGFDTLYLSSRWSAEYRGAANKYRSLMRVPGMWGMLEDERKQHDSVITSKAIEFISSNNQFFAMVGFVGPHPPYAAPQRFIDMYSGIEFECPDSGVDTNGHKLVKADWMGIKRGYCASVTWLDELIGKLVNSVPHGTIIIFTSDHGDILGDHGQWSKGVFAYEGNIRVPLLIRAAGLGNNKYEYIVQSIDIMPTILELIGINTPFGVQGKSIVSALKSDKPANEYTLSMIGWYPRLRMVRTDRYKYWIYGDDEVLMTADDEPINDNAVLCEMRYKLAKALIDAEDPLPKPFVHSVIAPQIRG